MTISLIFAQTSQVEEWHIIHKKKTINYTLRNDLTHMHEGIFESLFIDIQLGNDKITCDTIYSAPKQDRF